jgi:ABC-type multidrug transport system fused ATPase/permease subunit
LEKLEKGKLTELEKTGIYGHYAKKGGWRIVLLTIVMYSLLIFSRILTDWWAGKWAENYKNLDHGDYPLIFLYFACSILVFILLRTIIFSILVSNAGYNLFKNVMWNILRRPMKFFDTTPSGVVLNRCTKDVNDCDSNVPRFLGVFLDYMFVYIGALVMLSIASPAHILFVAVYVVVLVRWIMKYIGVSTEISRLVKLASSPIFSKISEVIKGFILIRGYR